MSIIPIYNCFHPIMKQKATPIKNITEEIKILSQNMIDTLQITDNGVGLAANQVGNSSAMFVVDLSDMDQYKHLEKFVFINPEIIEYSDETNIYNEGCLSVPTLYEDVERPMSIKIKWIDINGQEQIKDFDDFLARVIQHEYDHLSGILFFERLSSFRKTLSRNKLRNIKAQKFDINYEMINPDGSKYKV